MSRALLDIDVQNEVVNSTFNRDDVDNAEQVIAEQNANIGHYELPGRVCVVPAAEVFA